MSKSSVVIVSAKRTPSGAFQGDLSSCKATDLGAAAIKATLDGFDCEIDEVMMGCVLPAGLGQAPARQAALGAGLPDSTPCVTVNKMCGSGMKTIMLAHDSILAGTNDIVVAGGLESMTNSPYLLEKARSGYRMGHGKVLDHMFLDGLEDAYEGKLMGVYAEETAQKYQFTRDAQDKFAITSLERAKRATEDGTFADEITAVTCRSGKVEKTVTHDEAPLKANVEKIPTLRPAFKEGGTVTAANSSSISDGAASVLMMSETMADKLGYLPLARIVGHATHAQEPQWFTTAPVQAIQNLFDQQNWKASDVDLFEINEAFAVVTMAAMKEHSLPHDIVNIYGGACALGHPIGASGARIVVTLMNALQKNGQKRGVASLCIGGGEATALGIELI